MQVPTQGGAPRQITTTSGDGESWWPHYVPASNAVLYTVHSGAVVPRRIEIFFLDSGDSRVLLDEAQAARRPALAILYLGAAARCGPFGSIRGPVG